MILLVCSDTTCNGLFRCVGDPVELDTLVGRGSDFWPSRYRCPMCGAKASFGPEEELYRSFGERLTDRVCRDLEPLELFHALMGLGLPEEQRCTRAEVEELLRTHPIRRLGGHEVQGRPSFCLEFLELWDGTRMYLGASTHGAVIYRIVRPRSAATAVLREGNRIDG